MRLNVLIRNISDGGKSGIPLDEAGRGVAALRIHRTSAPGVVYKGFDLTSKWL